MTEPIENIDEINERRQADLGEEYRHAIVPPFWRRPTRAKVLAELHSLGVILFWVCIATLPPAAIFFYFITGGSHGPAK